MPVVRQMYWMALIPQCMAVAVLSIIVHVACPHLDIPFDIAIAALAYLIFCRIMRAKFVRDHASGMRAYHAQRFHDAISHFEASYRFFSAHRGLDKWRSLLFGVASRNPYRLIALCNMAYCYSQAGDGQRAIRLYEQALHEEPDCMLAKTSLNMLRSVSPTLGVLHMRSQVHIRNFSGALDWIQVERVLVSTAQRFGMADTTVTSRVPNTIFCCSQKVGYGFAIGGRVNGNLGIVDFYPGKQSSEHFAPVVESITSELQRIFSERYYVPQPSEFIEPQHTLPVSGAAREFHRQHFGHGPDASYDGK